MQYDRATAFTETYKALSVHQPDADEIAKGLKLNLRLKSATNYRGEILIVSSPNKRKERSGMTICKVDLIDCVRVKEGVIWKFQNPRPVVEMPCQKSTMRGTLWDCHYAYGEIIEYPRGSIRKFLNKEILNADR